MGLDPECYSTIMYPTTLSINSATHQREGNIMAKTEVSYSDFDELTVERRSNGVLLITLNRPESLNAFTEAMVLELLDLWQRIDRDRDAKIVVVTGTGKAFSVGGDIDLLDTFTEDIDGSIASSRDFARILRQLMDLDKPVITAVNGDMLGGGLGMALSSDVVYMSDRARILAGAQLNLSVLSGPEVYLWPLLTSPMKAKLHLFKADTLDAHTAEKIGLVSAVVPHAQLMDDALSLADELAERDAMALAWTKRACNHLLERARPALDAWLAIEGFMFTRDEAKAGLKWMRQTIKDD